MVRLLHEQAADLTARIGAPLELAGIAVRRLGRDRGDLPVEDSLFTTDALGLIKRDDVDVVIEVDGGIDTQTAPQAVSAGATVLVAGTAAFRGGPASYASNIKALRGEG